MSLASRRRMMLKGGAKAAEPKIDWSMSVLNESKATLPFPYNDDYIYALRTNAERVYSNYPIFVWKITWRDWAYIVASDAGGAILANISNSRWFNHDVDTSDLGDNYTKIRTNTKDSGDYLECNYPIYEVVYDADEQKFNVIRG